MPKENEDSGIAIDYAADIDDLDIKIKSLEERIMGYEKRVTIEAMLYGMEAISDRMKTDEEEREKRIKKHVNGLEEDILQLRKKFQKQMDYSNRLIETHNLENSAQNTLMNALETRNLRLSEIISKRDEKITKLEGDVSKLKDLVEIYVAVKKDGE